MPQDSKTFFAPCGWTAQQGEPIPAVEAAIASLKAAGLTAVIVWQDPAAPADEPDCGAEFTAGDDLSACQAFAREAAAGLCHLVRALAEGQG